MFNRPKPFSDRLWRLDEVRPDTSSDGPLSLLRSMLALGLHHHRILIACSAAGVILAGIYAYTQPPTFNATATLLLEPRQSAATGQEFGTQQGLDLNRADSELQTIRSERLLSEVFASLDLAGTAQIPAPLDADDVRSSLEAGQLSTSPTTRAGRSVSDDMPSGSNRLADEAERAAFLEFARHVDARRVGQSFVIEISYSSPDPKLPARVANAVVSGYIFQAVSFKEQTARAGTEALQGRLDALSRQVEAARQSMHIGALPSIPTPDSDARIIGAALPPLAPSGPRRKLIMLLGGLLGVFGGAAAITLRLALDRKVRNASDLSRELGVLCLGSIPDTPGMNSVPWHIDGQQQQMFVSAIHDIRTSIEIACLKLSADRGIAVAMVSWAPNTGVTTICSALAQLIDRGGRRVTLYQASQASTLSPSATDESQTSKSLADAAFTNTPLEKIAFFKVGGVAVLPIHSDDPNANLFSHFRTRRVQEIVEASREMGDIIFDLPPLQRSMDALALAAFADVVVVVARANETSFEEVSEAFQLLRRAGGNVIGTIINRTRS